MTTTLSLEEYNPQQRAAITYGDGPLLVVAGAGSGKTKTLAGRVAYLISKGVDPERILLLTFTRRASKEMIDRAAQALGQDAALASRVWGGTFHATANRILRIYGQALQLSPDFTIIDQSDSEDLLEMLRHKKIDAKNKGRFPRKGTLQAIYSRRMNAGEELDLILKNLFPWCERWKEELKAIYKEYVGHKQARSILDYDDLLLYWYYLLEDKKAAAIVAKRFDYILVDEYQDTNKLQADILVRMRASNKNIMAVGDDAQSIYSFRAATVRNMLDFPTLFPGTHIATLEQNYRSSAPILATTNLLIAQAKERFSKNLFTARTGGAVPQLITCKDEEGEADAVVERVLARFEEGIPLRKQAVLFRASSHSATLEIALMKKNIPFHKYGGLKFLEASHVKDFISIIRIVENRQDEPAWFRLLNLFEGIGPATAAAVYDHFRAANFSVEALDGAPVPKAVQRELYKFRSLLADLLGSESLTPASQLERIAAFYRPLLDANYENPQPRRNDIEHIVNLASGYKSRTQFLCDLILDPPASTSDLAGPPVRDEDYLVLSTIHSAKGCEWDAVYLIHAADGCLPSDMATGSDREIEEELRLAYVAMTRARDHLSVLWPLRFYSHPSGHSDRHVYAQQSRFFTKEVAASMEAISAAADDTEDTTIPLDSNIDVGDRLKKFWE
jgi:DNA helicase II / ATP-dependent DNA helicase PcrA